MNTKNTNNQKHLTTYAGEEQKNSSGRSGRIYPKMGLMLKPFFALLLVGSGAILFAACGSGTSSATIGTSIGGNFGSSGEVISSAASLPSSGAVSAINADYRIAPSSTFYNTSNSTSEQGIGVVGVGIVKAQPDEVEISFYINSEESSAQSASTIATTSKDNLLAALVSNGVAAEDINSGFSLYSYRPYDYERNREGDEVVYNASYSVSATLKDLSLLGGLLDEVVSSVGDRTNINGLTYRSSQGSELLNQARRAATADALARASLYADALGVELGSVVSLVELNSSGPVAFRSVNADQLAFASVAEGSAGISVDPDQVDFSINIQVVYSINS